MFRKKKEEEKKNPIIKEYSLWSNLCFIFWNMFHYQKALIFLIPLGALTQPVTAYLWTFVSKYVIELITAQKPWQDLIGMMLIFVVLMIGFLCIGSFYWGSTWYRYIGTRMSLMVRLNRKVMTMRYEHLEDTDVMDAFSKAQDAAGGNSNGVEGMMRNGAQLLNNIAVAIVGMIIMGTLSPWIILLILITGTLSYIFYDWTNARAKKTVWDVLSNWWRKNYYMNNITTQPEAAKDIRMFSLSDWLLSKRKELNDYRYQMQKKNERIWFVNRILGNIAWAISQIGVYSFIIYSVVQGNVSVADAFLYVASSATFYNYVNQVLVCFAQLRNTSRQVCDFRSFLDYESKETTETKKINQVQEKSVKKVPKGPDYQFEFQNVSFKYPKAEKYALKNLNLKLEPGERLAVVGLNGAGKSTFIKLLLRLYEPTEGRILLNGTDIKEFDIDSYFGLFAPVFQEVYEFAFPLVENVSMETPANTDEGKAAECLKMAGMSEKLQSLPNGIHTQMLKIIEDDGVAFSGGEKQKLALARALYKDAPVVVLDEPTAALDALAEYELYQNFDNMIGNKTAVYISHRLSSTRFCKHVAMFADGEMVEYGTHDFLIDLNGAYAEMFHVQAQYYVEEEGNTNVKTE